MPLMELANNDTPQTDLLLSLQSQLHCLTIQPDVNAQEKKPVKKKKKKVKAIGGKQTKTKKCKTNDQLVQVKPERDNKFFLNPEELDENEPTSIRFRKYGLDDFRFVVLLGTGGFGMVYLAKLARHKAYFAIKFMEKRQIVDNNDYQSVLMEKKVMLYGNNNPFICRLFCSFQTTSYLCFAMQFCCGGDLKFHLDKMKRFPVASVKFYMAEMICAIRYLHKLGIIYRDLKLDNVMISESGHIKLVDFGLCSGKIYRQEMMPTDFCGTLEYMAPEVIKTHPYNQSVDYWNLGIVAYLMGVGGYPFTGTDEDELCWCICNLNVTIPCFIPKDLQSLISQLLVKSAEERLGMPNSVHGKLPEHSFFFDVDWSQAEKGLLQPPYLPVMKSTVDTSHFEDVFTFSDKSLCLSELEVSSPASELFPDFEYTNPNMTE